MDFVLKYIQRWGSYSPKKTMVQVHQGLLMRIPSENVFPCNLAHKQLIETPNTSEYTYQQKAKKHVKNFWGKGHL
jgi:hypothetical protein